MPNIDSLIKRRDKASARVQEWRHLLDKTYRYAAPNKNSWRDTGGQGQKPASKGENVTAEIYDLTLLIGTRMFVNRLVNAVIPQTEQWLRFIPGPEIEEEFQDEAARLLQGLTDKFFSFIDNSNFYLAVPEAFEDCAISTGVIQINEGDDEEPLVFASVPSNSIAYEAGIDGSFKGYFRDFVGISADEILSYWPQGTVSEEIRKLDEECKAGGSKEIHVVEATLYNYKTKMWDTEVFELKTKHSIYSVTEEQPAFAAFRWNRRPGEILGRGPAMDAMPAAASINEAMKDELIAAAFKANPMYMAYTDSVINLDMFRVQPGAILPVLPTSAGGWPLTPVPSAGDPNFGILIVQDLREQINTLLMTQPLGSPDLPKQTATEAVIRSQQFSENAASSYARIKREFFDQIIKRIIYLLKKRGDWPDIKINGKAVAIRYETPLTATRGQREVEKFMTYHQMMAAVIGPEAAATVVNIPKLPFFLAENLEVDLKLVSSEKEINQAMEQMQQQAAAQQQEMQQQQPQQPQGV